MQTDSFTQIFLSETGNSLLLCVPASMELTFILILLSSSSIAHIVLRFFIVFLGGLMCFFKLDLVMLAYKNLIAEPEHFKKL